MSESYDLSKLDPYTFEHLTNTIAMRVLGLGHTTFGPGRDGGRDGYYEGDAPYPSDTERWDGIWYLQSKFHSPHLTADAQKWLLGQIERELKAFRNDSSRRWPSNWIVATNVDITAVPDAGTFDRARELVASVRPELAQRFHIWGGNKLISLLALYPSVAQRYAHFITPGHVLTELAKWMTDGQASVETIVRYLVVKQLEEQQHTRLEQAGASGESRPGIHRLFIDLPFYAPDHDIRGMVTRQLFKASAMPHRVDRDIPDTQQCRIWRRHPDRARVWFIKAGPGHGKSTIGQFFCQAARAALVLSPNAPLVTVAQRALAEEIRLAAIAKELWPVVPRIPISVDLKDYAQWYAKRDQDVSRGILTFLAERFAAAVEQPVQVGTLRRMLSVDAWFCVFDGLDEVPQDVKDGIATEVKNFMDHVAVDVNADLMALCTSRPQGYSGQFAEIDGPTVELSSLEPTQALACADPLLRLGRSEDEYREGATTIARAIESPSVRELMTTPLQSHIMAVIVRDGGRPPDRRWQLYSKFYEVIKKREANKNFPDRRLAKLLREDEQLLKTVHTRLGFLLHSRAETSDGAQTHLSRAEFRRLVGEAVTQLVDHDVDATVETLMSATVNRLVLVSTPDDGDHVRFDIRPLQEFFAAEFLYEAIDAEMFEARLGVLAGDSHWREVLHFVLSALVESQRRTELSIAIRTLSQLDGSAVAGPDRIARRRIARGATTAGRLLSEGVLEQDRRIRAEFRSAVEPLFATTDARLRESLAKLKHPLSLAWLRAAIHDVLREASPAESVGAGALAVAVGCEANQLSEVLAVLVAKPPAFLNEILRAVPRGPEIDEAEYSNVVVAVAAHALSTATWRSLSLPAMTVLFEIVTNLSDQRFEHEFSRLTATDRRILRWVAKDRFVRGSRTQQVSSEAALAFFTVSYGQDWSTAGRDDLGLDTDVDSRSDFVATVSRIAEFYRSPTVAALLAVLRDVSTRTVELLPWKLRGFLPLDFEQDDVSAQFDALLTITKEELAQLLRDGTFRTRNIRRPASLDWSDDFSYEGWTELVRRHPATAMMVWARRDIFQGRRLTKPLDSKRAVDTLINRAVRWPSILRNYPASWGRLIKAMPTREQDLRGAFLRCASESVTPMLVPHTVFEAIRVDLPSEASLLPFVVTAVIQHDYRASSVASINDVRERVRDHVGNVGRDSARKLEGLSAVARAALQMLAILQSGDLKDDDGDILVAGYSTVTGRWLFESVAATVRIIAAREDSISRSVVGKLLDVSREDYAMRTYLDPLLSWWREASLAPTTSGSFTSRWLSGSE
jgi:hypothetical protein